MIIAIDGPSGAGKGTISRTLADELGYRHIDTGAMYRAVAWKALHEDIPLDDEEAVAALAHRAAIDIEGRGVSVDGHDVTRAIRTPEIDRASSAVARLPKVREVLVARQRELGRSGNAVMEGRDIGTVVFPDADIKIYLDASEEERVRRRASDPAHTGSQAGQTAVAEAIKARDTADSTRTASPLSMAPDSIHIDTTSMSIIEVVERILSSLVLVILPADAGSHSVTFRYRGELNEIRIANSRSRITNWKAFSCRGRLHEQGDALRARLRALRVVQIVETLLLRARRVRLVSLQGPRRRGKRTLEVGRHRHRVNGVERVPRAALLGQLDLLHAGVGHQAGGDQLLDARLVARRPPALRLARREQLFVIGLVNGVHQAVDPSEAERFLDGVVVADGREAGVLLREPSQTPEDDA